MKNLIISILIFILGWEFANLTIGQKAEKLGYKVGQHIRKIFIK